MVSVPTRRGEGQSSLTHSQILVIVGTIEFKEFGYEPIQDFLSRILSISKLQLEDRQELKLILSGKAKSVQIIQLLWQAIP